MVILRYTLMIVVMVIGSTPSFAQESPKNTPEKPKTVQGVWLTHNKKAFVEIKPCSDNLQNMCGKIIKLTKPLNKHGQEKLDRKNKNPALRSRKLVGLPILENFKATDEANLWDGGTIYNGADGETYDSTIALEQDDRLLVKGCVWIMCKSQYWTRQ